MPKFSHDLRVDPMLSKAGQLVGWHLCFAKEFDRSRAREQAGRGAAIDQFADGLFAAIAVAEGPFVDVHGDEFVSGLGFHVAGELHGVIEGFFAMFEAVFNAVADGTRDLAAEFRTEGSTNGIAAKRQGKTVCSCHQTPRSMTRCRPSFGNSNCPS